ncbi:Major facilitator superfamily domain containing protein [Rhypophila sp. PSN 637]
MEHQTLQSISTPDEHQHHQSAEKQEKPSSASESSRDLEPEPEWLTGTPLLILMVALSIVMFLALLDGSIIGTAAPRIRSEFRSLEDLGWYGSAFQLAGAAVQPLTGKIYATLNQKWTFIWFFATFEVGCLVCGAAVSSNMLIAGRAVAGLGVAGLQNGGLTIIASAVPIHRRATMNGILVGLSQLGIVMGPLIGGAFTSYSTWRWYGFCQVFTLTSRLRFWSPRQCGFAFELLLALQWGGSVHAWDSSVVIGLLCGAVVTLAVFLHWQHRQEGCLVRVHRSAILSGVYTLPNILAQLGAAILSGVLVEKLGYYLPWSVASAIVTSIATGLMSTFDVATSVGNWIGYQILFGAGCGMGIQMVSTHFSI